MHACGGQRSAASSFLNHSLPYLVGSLSLNLELICLDWRVSRPNHPLVSSMPSLEERPIHAWLVLHGSWGFNAEPQAFEVRTLLTEPSPQTPQFLPSAEDGGQGLTYMKRVFNFPHALSTTENCCVCVSRVSHAGLEHVEIPLPQPPECWDVLFFILSPWRDLGVGAQMVTVLAKTLAPVVGMPT